MKKLAGLVVLALLAASVVAGCGIDKGNIPDSAGPPKGGPPANSAHPPGLTDAEKNAPGSR